MKLNPIIRGWANSTINWHSNRTFHNLDHYVFNLCVRWMYRTHPNKGWKWLKAKYFKHKMDPPFNNKWVFHGRFEQKGKDSFGVELLQFKWFHPFHHIIIRNVANPDDRYFKDYFDKLKNDRNMRKPISMVSRFDKEIALAQDHFCPVCSESIYNDEPLHRHHIIPRKEGGKNTVYNLILLHLACHQSVHYGQGDAKWAPVFRSFKDEIRKSKK